MIYESIFFVISIQMDGKVNYCVNRILNKSRNMEVGGTAASTKDKDQVGGKRSILVAFWGFWGL